MPQDFLVRPGLNLDFGRFPVSNVEYDMRSVRVEADYESMQGRSLLPRRYLADGGCAADETVLGDVSAVGGCRHEDPVCLRRDGSLGAETADWIVALKLDCSGR